MNKTACSAPTVSDLIRESDLFTCTFSDSHARLYASLTRKLLADHPEVEAEKLLGAQVAFALREASGVDEDPLLANWVRQIGERVAAVSPRRDIRCTFDILRTDAANALAAPGGYLFVTRGMLDTIDSDDELAVILAHEVGHHTKKHAMRQVGANLIFLLGLNLIHGKNSVQIRNGLVILNVLYTLGRSRQFEAQADDLGLQFATQTGYDPAGMIHFFDGFDLRRRSRLQEYFSTHPAPLNRQDFARRSPLVNRSNAEAREIIARGYENRGLPEAAIVTRRGGDPLALRFGEPILLPDYLREEQAQIHAQAEDVRKSLDGTFRTQQFGSTMQTLLLINNQADIRWLLLASQAYSVQTRVEDLLARASRVAKTIAPTYDALASYSGRERNIAREATEGRVEVRRSLERIRGVSPPLLRAARAVATVLTDLNNRFLRLSPTATWLRYGALEGLLQYAITELGRADEMSGIAWRRLALARIRRYQLRLNDIVPEGNIVRRSRWYDLAQRRIGRALDGSGPAGEATVRAALGVERGVTDSRIAAERGGLAWADWVLESGGVPENVATVMRLLTLDLEREFQAKERYGVLDVR